MADPAETQAGYVEFLTELALMHLHPGPMPPQPASPIDLEQALEQMGGALFVLYGSRRS